MTKNTRSNTVPIFFAVDDNYAPFLAVALRSLIDNSSKKRNYSVYILIQHLNDENTQKLSGMATDNVSIEFVNISEQLNSLHGKLHLRDYYTCATYYRFFIPEMFPQYKKGIYLDCDILVLTDIAKLYDTKLSNELVAAVNDEVVTSVSIFSDYVETVVGVPNFSYFNAGILLMNLEEMRNTCIDRSLAELMSVRTFKVAQDQDYLNLLCCDRVKYLSVLWNKTASDNCDATKIPYIVHFNLNWKPWHYDNISFGELFWKYAKNTEYLNDIKQVRENYGPADIKKDEDQFGCLLALAKKETDECNGCTGVTLDINELGFAEV